MNDELKGKNLRDDDEPPDLPDGWDIMHLDDPPLKAQKSGLRGLFQNCSGIYDKPSHYRDRSDPLNTFLILSSALEPSLRATDINDTIFGII